MLRWWFSTVIAGARNYTDRNCFADSGSVGESKEGNLGLGSVRGEFLIVLRSKSLCIQISLGMSLLAERCVPLPLPIIGELKRLFPIYFVKNPLWVGIKNIHVQYRKRERIYVEEKLRPSHSFRKTSSKSRRKELPPCHAITLWWGLAGNKTGYFCEFWTVETEQWEEAPQTPLMIVKKQKGKISKGCKCGSLRFVFSNQISVSSAIAR